MEAIDPANATSGPIVLVVDDDPFVCQLLERLLTMERYRVRLAADGNEAMRLLLNEAPAFVITDWEMPGMNGLDLCRAIRAHEGVGFVYTIVMTAHSGQDQLVAAFDAGADDFLAKPFNRRELIARLRAGERIVALESDLAGQRRELFKYNVEMELANRKLAAANEKLNIMATTDGLTGLTNRRAAMDRAQEYFDLAQRHAQPFACILLDIDHFKKFNDTHGHDVGDMVLKAAAGHLRQQARSGEIVCRIGGEEFLILCPSATAAQAANGAERQRAFMEGAAVDTPAGRLRVTVSIGVAEYRPEMTAADELLKRADEALYESKRGGRNRVTVAGAQRPPAEAAPQAPSCAVPALVAAETGGDDAEATSILLVEDDASQRASLRCSLEQGGFRVREAEHGAAALRALEDEIPDVVVMDARMPEMDGLECTRRIRAQPALADLPIMMVAAGTDGEDVPRGFEAGVDTYIMKPIRGEELVIRVRAMARWRRRHQQLMRNNETLAEQTRLLSLLLDYSRLANSVEDLATIVDQTLSAAAALAGCRQAVILLSDNDGAGLRPAGHCGISGELAARMAAPVRSSISGAVFETRDMRPIGGAADLPANATDGERSFFATAPGVSIPLTTSERGVGVLNLSGRVQREPFPPQQLEFLGLMANIAASTIEDLLLRRSRDQARDTIVVALAKLAEHRDDDTGRHVDRVTRYCMMLARTLRESGPYAAQIDDQFLAQMERAAPLHDIGKVGVPDAILLKRGRLTPEEMRVMQTHAVIGREVIRSVAEGVPDAGFLRMGEQIAYSHHEWFDGTGYPARISGHDIPLAARIVSVADVYDAITTPRVYKPALSHERAVAILREGAGTQFDPVIVEAFLRNEDEIRTLSRALADTAVELAAAGMARGRQRAELGAAAAMALQS